MKQFAVLLGLSLLLPSMAQALPILSESEDSFGRLALILPDHDSPKTRYFFPNRGGVELNSSGEPRFALSYWDAASDAAVGGFMSGIFNLRIGGDLKEAVQENIKNGYKTSVLPVQKSYLRFMQKEDGERTSKEIFHEVSLPPFAGNAGDSIGISATLTPWGGKALAQQILSSGYAAELNYCYVVKGVSPVFDAEIYMDFKKVYTHFVAQASGGKWWWKWSVRHEVQKLIQSGDVRITITGGDAKENDYIMAIADKMTVEFLKPLTENRLTGTSGKYGVASLRIEEMREQTYKLTKREIIEREYCVALGIDELKKYPHLIVKVQ